MHLSSRLTRAGAALMAAGLAIIASFANAPLTLGQQAVAPAQRTWASGPAVRMIPSRLPRLPAHRSRAVPRRSRFAEAELNALRQRGGVPGAPARVLLDPTPTRPAAPAPRPLTPTLQSGFEGVNQDANVTVNSFVARPPDPEMAAGPNHIVQVVNSLVRISTKDGATLLTTALSDWFGPVGSQCDPVTGCDPFDPRVTYDPQEGHWILTALHETDSPAVSRVLFSVSQTSDPTGTWFLYNLDGSLLYGPAPGENTFSDYDDVGFDGILSTAATSGAIYITANMFTFSGGSFRTAQLWIISKAQAYAGAGLSFWTAWDRLNADTSEAFTLRTAKTYAGNPGVEFLADTDGGPGNFITVWNVTPTYPPTSVNWTLRVTIAPGAYGLANSASQPGCANTLDTIDTRLINLVWRNNRLYTAFTESNGTTGSSIRYNRINTSTNTLETSTSFGAANTFYFVPAVTVDSLGDAAIAFTRSSTSEFASAYYTGHLAGGALQPSTLMHAGAQCITGFRWGDYAEASVDPLGFRRIWLINEWAAISTCGGAPLCNGADWDWSTWVARVQFGVVTTIGVYNPNTGFFYERNSNTTGVADTTFQYGPGGLGWIPLSGDWTGQGIKTPGLYNPTTGFFYLRNSSSTGVADLTFQFGPGGLGWVPMAGDWNSDGTTSIGLYAPNTGFFYLRNSNSTGVADLTFQFGPGGAGWVAKAGDWDGDNTTTIGLYAPNTGFFYLRNANSTGVADLTFQFGPGGLNWNSLSGDWDGR